MNYISNSSGNSPVTVSNSNSEFLRSSPGISWKLQLLTKSSPRKAGNGGSFKEFAHSGVKNKTTFSGICAFRSHIAIFSRRVVHSIAQVCNAFQGICASRNLKYYSSSNLVHSRAQSKKNPGDLCIQELKVPHRSLCLQELKYFIFRGNLCIREPQMLQGICASESSRYYVFLGGVCLQALAEPTPLLATLPDRWLHSCQSSGQILRPPTPRILPWKNVALSLVEYVEDFLWSFLWPLSWKIEGWKWAKIITRISDAFFSTVSAKTLPENFAIRDYVQKRIVEKYRLLLFFCAYALSHTLTDTHTQKKKKCKEGKKPVTVTNSEIQIRTN